MSLDASTAVVRIKGTARYMTADTGWKPLKVGMVLKPNYVLREKADQSSERVSLIGREMPSISKVETAEGSPNWLKVTMNDSLTEFKLVGVATSGVGLFGTGSSSVKTKQDQVLNNAAAATIKTGCGAGAATIAGSSTSTRVGVGPTSTLTGATRPLGSTNAPAPVWMPQPKGPSSSNAESETSSGTFTTFFSVHRQCVANDDWPKKLCRTSFPSSDKAALPSLRRPTKLVPAKSWQ